MKNALFGYGGHADEVMCQIEKSMTCFVDDDYACKNTIPISKFNPREYKLMIAVGDSEQRKKIIDKLPYNTQFFTFIHPTAQIMDKNITIRGGTFIGANSILTTDIKIGKHALLNRGNHISHGCNIGDFFSMMPGSLLSGDCIIGDNVYIGSNACVLQKIKIVSSVIIGAQSLVAKNITKSGTYVGIPTRKL